MIVLFIILLSKFKNKMVFLIISNIFIYSINQQIIYKKSMKQFLIVFSLLTCILSLCDSMKECLATPCIQGYVLNPQSSQCIRQVVGCQIYTGDNVCNSCYKGYIFEEGKCRFFISIFNCQRQSNNVCVQCDFGYYLDRKREKCLRIPNLDTNGNRIQDAKQNQINLKSDPVKLRDGLIPCNSNNCGESQNLQEQEYLSLLLQNKVQKQTIINIQNRKSILRNRARTLQASSDRKFSINLNHPRDFSETNNQDVNIDEADLLKNDGDYIYTISGKFLNIVRAYPIDKFRLINSFNLHALQGAHPVGLFIDGNKLALFAVGKFLQEKVTVVLTYDIKNKGNIVLQRKYLFHGRYFDARMNKISGYIHFLSQSQKPDELPWFSLNPKQLIFIERNSIFKWRYYLTTNILNVISFSLRAPKLQNFKMVSFFSKNPDIMYMTYRNLYFTNRVGDSTRIHKVAVWSLRIVPIRDRVFPGILHNQFSLDEYQGTILRIAATGKRGISLYSYDAYFRRYGTRNLHMNGHEITSARFLEKKVYIGTSRNYFFHAQFIPTHIYPLVYKGIKYDIARYIHILNSKEIFVFGKRSKSDEVGFWIIQNNNNFLKVKSRTSIHIPGASSSLQVEHKSFLIYPKNRIVVFPLKVNSILNGAMALAFNLNKKGNYEIKWRSFDHQDVGQSFNDADVERSLFINEYIYTKSKCWIIANTVDQVKTGYNHPFPPINQAKITTQFLKLKC